MNSRKPKPTKAFLAGLSKQAPEPAPYVAPVTALPYNKPLTPLDWRAKFAKLIGEATEPGRLKMVRKWLKLTGNVDNETKESLIMMCNLKLKYAFDVTDED